MQVQNFNIYMYYVDIIKINVYFVMILLIILETKIESICY